MSLKFLAPALAALVSLTGCLGSSTSTSGALPQITAHPHDTTAAAGANASFAVTAEGATGYQWIRNATDTLAGATSATLALPGVDSTLDGSTYKCIVRNATGTVVSNAATLHVFVPDPGPVITMQPASVTVLPGGTAVFSIAATGENLGYQWYRGDFLLAGQSAATLSISNLTSFFDGTVYRCRVSNPHGEVLSAPAVLRISALRALLIDTGATVFQGHCAGCHGISGRGSAGFVPPLANSDHFLANRRKSIESTLGGAEDSLFVNGLWYHGSSPAFAEALTDVEIAGVLTYLRAVLNDSTVSGCNSGALDGNGFPTCVKTPRGPAEIAADSVSLREVQLVRDSLFPL